MANLCRGLTPQAWPSSNLGGIPNSDTTELIISRRQPAAWGKHGEAPGPLSTPLSAFISVTVFIWVWNYLVCVSVYWLITCRPKLCGRYTIGYYNPSIYNGAGCIADIQQLLLSEQLFFMWVLFLNNYSSLFKLNQRREIGGEQALETECLIEKPVIAPGMVGNCVISLLRGQSSLSYIVSLKTAEAT